MMASNSSERFFSLRRILFGSLAVLIAMAGIQISSPKSAEGQDDGGWWYLLLNVETYELTRVNGDATVQSYDLGPQADDMFERQFAVSPDVSLATYCTLTMVEIHDDDEVPFMTLVIYDLETEATRFEVDLGPSDGCYITNASFSDDGDLLGVGLISPHYDSDYPAWRLPIVDTETGEIVQEIDGDDALVADNSELFGEFNYFMPAVGELTETEVVFRQVLWRTEGGYLNEAVRWNWGENTLMAEPDRNNGIWIEETGELIWVERDDSLPLADPQAPIGRRNVVRVRGADGETRTLFFTGEQVVQTAMLINSGRELLIRTYDGYDEENPAPQESHWLVLDREGNLRELEIESEGGFVRVLNAPNGFVTIANTSEDVVSIIAHENGEERVLWETDDTFRMLVGQSRMPIAEGLEPFAAVD